MENMVTVTAIGIEKHWIIALRCLEEIFGPSATAVISSWLALGTLFALVFGD